MPVSGIGNPFQEAITSSLKLVKSVERYQVTDQTEIKDQIG